MGNGLEPPAGGFVPPSCPPGVQVVLAKGVCRHSCAIRQRATASHPCSRTRETRALGLFCIKPRNSYIPGGPTSKALASQGPGMPASCFRPVITYQPRKRPNDSFPQATPSSPSCGLSPPGGCEAWRCPPGPLSRLGDKVCRLDCRETTMHQQRDLPPCACKTGGD